MKIITNGIKEILRNIKAMKIIEVEKKLNTQNTSNISNITEYDINNIGDYPYINTSNFTKRR